MKWALVSDKNIVTNIIEYNGTSFYTPPPGMSLVQINDWVNIGDPTDKPQPA